MKNKVCNKCGENKNVSDFYVGNNQCKECRKEYQKKYKEENKEKVKECKKKYREENKEKIKEYDKKYYKENKEKVKECKKKYYEENKEKILERIKEYGKKYGKKYGEYNKEYQKKYREENKEYYKEYMKEYIKFRRKNDPLFRLTDNIRSLITNSFKKGGYTKKTKTYKILGCSFEDFKKHIESQFEDWMNWDNYGLYNGEECYGWDFDHIIPVCSCECEDDIYRLNHYSNFQPLCSYLNRYVKRDNLDWEL